MAIALNLQVRQSQALVLTPQLQQAIKLLQLSTPELLGTIDRELAENPFLTVAESGSADARPAEARPAAPERTASLDGAPPLAGREGAEEPGVWDQPPAAAGADQRLGVKNHAGNMASGGRESEARSTEAWLSEEDDLRDLLRRQVGAMRVEQPEHRALAMMLVDWIDDDGYLRESDEALARELDAPRETVAAARALLQGCDPPGIGARDLAECLAIQLREKNRYDPAMAALIAHLPHLARADWNALLRACKVDREDLEEMIAEIKALDPRPGRAFAGEPPTAVIPDVFVYRTGAQGWRVELNTGVLPRLVVDDDYHAEITRTCKGAGERGFIAERFQNANWLTRALQQRARTILRVSRAIFERQQRYLEEGPAGLRPLVLRDIAAATGLHESTVSRATSDKYVETPHGTVPLKYFFTTAIQSRDGGEDHSAEAIKQQIRRLVQQEAAGDVLSDDQIVTKLREAGIKLARRTVAKYREALGIPSSVERRRARALVR